MGRCICTDNKLVVYSFAYCRLLAFFTIYSFIYVLSSFYIYIYIYNLPAFTL